MRPARIFPQVWSIRRGYIVSLLEIALSLSRLAIQLLYAIIGNSTNSEGIQKSNWEPWTERRGFDLS